MIYISIPTQAFRFYPSLFPARLCLSVRNPELILALPTQSTLLRGVVRIEQKQTSFLYIDALDTRTRLVTLNADADHDSHTSGSLDSSANLQTSASDAEAGLHGKYVCFIFKIDWHSLLPYFSSINNFSFTSFTSFFFFWFYIFFKTSTELFAPSKR